MSGTTVTLSVTVDVAVAAQALVSAGSLTSVFLAGRRLADGVPRFPRLPWLLLVGAHGTFLAYALWSRQPGFLPLNVGMIVAGLVNLRAAYVARRPRVEPVEEHDLDLGLDLEEPQKNTQEDA